MHQPLVISYRHPYAHTLSFLSNRGVPVDLVITPGSVKLSPNDQVEHHADHKHVIQCLPDKASIHTRQSSLSLDHARNECHAIYYTQKENKCHARNENKTVHNLMLPRIKGLCTTKGMH
jgi:hypothetical protein